MSSDIGFSTAVGVVVYGASSMANIKYDLIITAAATILALYLYNKYEAYKAKKEIRKIIKDATHSDRHSD